MIIAGEPSGDMLAAELIAALKAAPQMRAQPFPPAFFGAGGACLAAEGVELAIDLTEHAIFGIAEVLTQYLKFRRFFWQLVGLAISRRPDVIILVDYSGFNLRFAKAVKQHVRAQSKSFNNWRPKIVYYVSPQVWASRSARARSIAKNVDLLLSIFPFEKEWYAARVPQLPVEFVGHPMVDRYASNRHSPQATPREQRADESSSAPLLLLLPGSRKRELEAHLPTVIAAAHQIKARKPVRLRMVLPGPELVSFALNCIQPQPDIEIQTGRLGESLAEASLAIAASGTVTLECAYFGVPTVVLYKTSRLTHAIARRIIQVPYIAMPNILAGERVFPEFIQSAATPENISREALDLLTNIVRRTTIKEKLAALIRSLGPPGAATRAAEAILRRLPPGPDLRAHLLGQ